MPGRISYNGIFVDFQNEWTRFNPNLISKSNVVRSASGIAEHLKQFEQEFISTEMRLVPGQDEIQLQRFLEYANDGSTFELWRNRDLGTYISFEGGGNSATVPTITPRGLQTNDKVAGTFTRTNVNDSAWYLDPSTGLMTVTPNSISHIPRFVAGRYGQHAIQIDGAATNLIDAPSGPFGTGNWAATTMGLSANTNETQDPAETNIADRLTASAGSAFVQYTSSTAVGNDVAISVWLKSSTGNVSCRFSIRGTSGGSVEETFTVTPVWTPFSMTADTSTGFTGDLIMRYGIDTNTEIVYAWGAGLYDSFEFDPGIIGATQTSSSITRNAELLTYLSANIVNRDRGTVAMWVKPSFDPTSQSGTSYFIETGDSGGADADTHFQFFYTATDRLRLIVRGDNVDTFRINYTPAVSTGMTQNSDHFIGFTYDATVSNGGHIFSDGVELSTGSTNGAFNISETGDTFSIGSKINNTQHAFSAIDEIIVTPDVKSASWFQQIFSRGRAIGEGRNYWSSVRLSNLSYVRQALRGGRSTIPLEFEEVIT